MRGFALARALLGLSTSVSFAAPLKKEYEYIIVGSGPGGGTLAARLAYYGHSVLLLESGDDQSNNYNVTVPGYMAAVTEDPAIRWDVFVNHYQDQERAQRDPKYVWETAPYQYHVGPGAPAGAKPRGILYPRAGTLGGCASHNALIWITPHDSDWANIANITGDKSWAPENMKQFENTIARWLKVGPTDPTILVRDLSLTQQYLAGAAAAGVGPDPLNAVGGLLNLLLNDPNNNSDDRDSAPGYFQVPLTMKDGTRTGVYRLLADTVSDNKPLTIQTNTFVTKVLFNTSGTASGGKPKATGVEFLQGSNLYRASPLSGRGGEPTKGTVRATREVIIAGGAYNTPQLLKLSGIGPAAELKKFNIPVLKDLPGVGKNLQDRYEVPVNVNHTRDFAILDGCTFDAKPHDKCLQQWINSPDLHLLGTRGAYATNGLAAAYIQRSSTADNSDNDLITFGGPVNFDGYFPGWSNYAIREHSHFSWYTLKAHTRNKAGTVELSSADPLDPPTINFNYFDTGTTENGADTKDTKALVEAIKWSRKALSEYSKYGILLGPPFVEQNPGPEVESDEDLETFVKDVAWGHHASCTAPIGADDDPDAVLDSSFRVRGIDSLRVVDASVFPKIPGIFIQAPIYIISEKAAQRIHSDAQAADNEVPTPLPPGSY
ncbi:hypothetical protein V8E36_000643 [Tilletia maclaganii]